MHKIVFISLLAASSTLASCGGGNSDGNDDPGDRTLIGGQYAQCEGRSGGGVDRSEPVMRTIQTHAPGEEINCTDKHAFAVEGRQVHLVYLAFGRLNDCPAGCFSADLCAIHDGNQSLLYDVSGSSNKPDRPGLAHPVVATQSFQDFRTAQRTGGPWRFCFRSD